MSTRKIDVRASSDAPVGVVWALLADVESWTAWAPFDEAELERPGHPDPQGVGALRRFRAGRTKNLEEVVRFDPPRALSYEVRAGDVPIRAHHADVELAAADGGTRIIWQATFRAKYPGTGRLIERKLRAFIQETADGVARYAAETESAGHPVTGTQAPADPAREAGR